MDVFAGVTGTAVAVLDVAAVSFGRGGGASTFALPESGLATVSPAGRLVAAVDPVVPGFNSASRLASRALWAGSDEIGLVPALSSLTAEWRVRSFLGSLSDTS